MKGLLVLVFLLYPLVLFAQEEHPQYRVYLVGDAGEMEDGHHPVVEDIRKKLLERPDLPAHLIYLGDNVYPLGLPATGTATRPEAELILKTQLDLHSSLPGKIWMIPGNHDWKKGKAGGWEAILRAGEFIEENYSDAQVALVPEGGCPGPYITELDEHTLLVAFDSQWWLHSADKPGTESDCEFKTEEEVISSIGYMLAENQHKTILFAMHHPMRAYGPHNGAYSWKDHLFPLTLVSKNLYIPLPVLGSVYPAYRTLFGDIQDIPHPKYQAMIKSLERLFATHPHVIQVSGHEHGLFYTREGKSHYIVSGAGAKNTFIKKKNPAAFTYPQQGYAVLDFYENHRVVLTFFDPLKVLPLFETELIRPFGEDPQEAGMAGRTIPDTVQRPISAQYLKGVGHRFFFGSNYRDTWAIPADFPVFDIARTAGGMAVVKRGGGMQTRSLRLKDKEGKEFVLRSVNKFPENALSPIMRQTIAKQVVQDQISSSHPYAALAVARLAEAVGVTHTNPRIVYLPDDPLLGIYRRDFGNELYLFEEREIAPPWVSSSEFFSTDKMMKKLVKDNDHQVKQKEVLKARIFDLWIADWDRHDDQWRWVGQKGQDGWEFTPMPRDRDQAFFVNEGVFPKIASRKWANPKFQGFGYELGNVNGFMFNGRYFDRSFLTGLDRSDWEEQLDEIIPKLTDDVISGAFQDWPDQIQARDTAGISAKLRARKAWLKDKSMEYYRFLSREVDVVGSDKHEEFEVRHFTDGRVAVEVRKVNKSGNLKQRFYNRTFLPEETREIRLYGLKGNDRFVFNGEGPGQIKIRVLPGEGDNEVEDRAKVKGKKHLIYPTDPSKEGIAAGASSRIKRVYNPDYLVYDRKQFKYDKLMPLASVEFNQDDGIFLGAGVLWEKNGFKKSPYAVRQSILANYALRTGSFNIRYHGHAVDLAGNLDMVWKVDVQAPDYVFNYFGNGNESRYDIEERDIRYYRARYSLYKLFAGMQSNLGESGRFTLGPHYQVFRFDPSDNVGKFIVSPESGLDVGLLDRTRFYTGLSAEVEYDKRDNKTLPTRGFHYVHQLTQFLGLNDVSGNLTRMDMELALYWSFSYPSRLVWASRFGGGRNWGDHEFFQGQTLGGMENLRGYRRYRFNGDAVLYNNTEFRLQLFNLRSFLLPATVGLVGFHDIGRVWMEGEASSKWHNTFGLGLSVAPLNQIVATLSVGFNEEETLPFFSFGYQF